jgi:hypothetical protein
MSLFFPKRYAREKLFQSIPPMCVTENPQTAFRTLGGSKLSTLFSLGFTLLESQCLVAWADDHFLPIKAKILTQL